MSAATLTFPHASIALWRRPLFVLSIFVLSGLLVYFPSLHGEPFWDDRYLIGENPFFRSPIFALEVFRHHLFFDSFSTYYRPVQNLSYIVDYWVWGGAPFGYHLTNVLLHSVGAFLLYLLLRQILPPLLASRSEPRAGLIRGLPLALALLWLVHPIHNAAVAYISGRADSLASLFALSAWLLVRRCVRAERRKSQLAYGTGAAAAMLLALCSKEIALIWLVIFLGHLFFWEREYSRRTKVALLGGAVAVFACYTFLHSLPPPRTPMADGPPEAFAGRVLLMLRAMGDYTRLLIFPTALMMERTLDTPEAYTSAAAWRAHSAGEYLSILGAVALAAFAFFSLKRCPGQRLRAFGAAWWMAAFLPISNLFPLNAQVAEHWIYLASIGFLLFLAGCVMLLNERVLRWLPVCAAVAIVALGARTALRAGEWSDPEVFYLRNIQVGGGSPRIYQNLAMIYGARGDHRLQEQFLRACVKKYPGYVPARISLGVLLAKQERSAEAETLLEQVQSRSETVSTQFARTWSAALSMADSRAKANRHAEALAILDEARRRFPAAWPLARAEAQLRNEVMGPAPAIEAIQDFADAHWWHLEAHVMLGQLRFAAGELDPAIAALRHAARLDIRDAKPLAAVAAIELQRGRPGEAHEAQLAAIRRDPHQPGSYALMAEILRQLGRASEASEALRTAAEMRSLAAGGS